ncbi:MAG: PPOX class F420-dependent oxidoreductase [Sphaerobacteraceae bacterium]|nr:MAG: PPOX class F420-dependent oxidoreductase [Sphaerobacteraceae bacterium]
MEKMTEIEWRQFLEEHRSPAIAAVTRPDGRPHASPLWIYPTGDEIIMTMFHTAVRTRALMIDPRMTLVVQDDAPPYRYVVIEGRVSGFEKDLDTVRYWAGKLGGRYMGEDRTEEFAERNGIPGEWLTRFVINHVRADKNITD